MAFRSEALMLDQIMKNHLLCDYLRAEGVSLDLRTYVEPTGLFGIPDVVIAGFSKRCARMELRETFAFELKLTKWRRALIQAYRYKAFSDRVYVVLDHDSVGPALSNRVEFERVGVGLLSLTSSNEIRAHVEPRKFQPFSASLAEEWRSQLETSIATTSSV